MQIKKTTLTISASQDFLEWMTSKGYPHQLSRGLFDTMYALPKRQYLSDSIWERKVQLPQFLIKFVEFVMHDVNLYQITDIEFVPEE